MAHPHRRPLALADHDARPAALPAERALGADDLARLDAGQWLHDALAAARPGFLALGDDGGSPTLFVDGVLVGPVTALHHLPVAWVERVALLARDEALALHGAFHGRAALAVRTRGAPGADAR